MKKTLTRLFTVALLLMVSLGARAEVKVLFGVDGTELQPDKDGKVTLGQKELTGGTVIISQEDQKNGTTELFLAVTPDKGYRLAENGLEVYTVAPADISQTRTVKASTKLDIKSEDFTDEASKRTYTATIDSNLALWLKSANFQPQKRENGAKDTGDPDFSGVWYIANETNHSSTTISSHWYLVPGADPQQSHYADAYFHNQYCNTSGKGDYTGDNYGDSEKPFLTTYQTNRDLNSIWIVVSTGDGYYNIIHAKTGKYIVYEPPYKEAQNRKSMHLESTTTPGDNAKFTISGSSLSSSININPKNVTSGNMYFNPAIAQGNYPRYYGTGTYFHEGMIGLYSASNDKSQWYFEDASSATTLTPVISDVDGSTNTFTITSPAAAFSSIRYTTDGSTTPNASTGNTVASGSPITITSTCNVQAVGVFGTTFVTPVAGPKELSPVATPPTISYNNATGLVTISSAAALSYYYTTNGDTPTTSTGTLYETPFPVTTATTVKAIAIYAGSVASEPATLEITQVATPTIQKNGSNAISITTTVGATIYYTTDGSTPTPGADGTFEYTDPLTENVSNVTIKAIAVKEGMITSAVGSGKVMLQCATPVITRDGLKFTLSCSMPTDATFYYSLDGSTPETLYNGPVSFTSELLPMTVKAVARHNEYTESEIVSVELRNGSGTAADPYVIYGATDFANFIADVNAGTTFSACYKLGADVSGSGVDAITRAFTGTFDGGMHIISDLGHALFNTVTDGVVKNVILDNVGISGGTNVGAICNEATGDTRIYNCGILATNSTVEKDDDGYDHISSSSSTISGSGYVGSIVGLLDGTSRVINCFSYADVSGGSEVGGIVGHNNVATTSAADNLKTMVMNCMFYGEVSGGSIAPIYNGEIITNDGDANGVNNFNYFRLESSYIQNTGISKVYNCALGAETRFLQRFEFYRHLLNSNRELAAWWAMDDADKKDEIMKWVMEPSQIGTSTPYPILKTPNKYASVVNYTPSETAYDEENRNKGRKLTNEGDGGVLHVTIQMGSGGAQYNAPSGAGLKSGVTGSFDLTITDKDFEHFNFNYGKVQLPYYNDYCDGNYTGYRVVTGWKIVSITGGTTGSYSIGDDVTYTNGKLTSTPYNFADRQCTNKDLYGTNGSNRVFNQGAYWDVPEGVTAITIEPYWGKAVYLADAYWDVVYKNGTGSDITKAGSTIDAMTSPANVPNVGGGQHYGNGESFNNQIVFTSISDAISSSIGNGLFNGATGSASHTVYDYAVVLVGNYHHTTTPEAGNGKPYTVTSVDLDGDNEPDYSLMLRFNGRTGFHPVRYDFLNLIGLGMAQKATGGIGSYNLGIMQPKYWFEVTNTALFRVTQFEYSPATREKKPIILQGGVIEQWVTQQQDAGDRVEYFHVGGNVWFKEFHRGSHQDNDNKSTPHPPVSVTGGDFNKFYLTGYYQSKAAIYDDNAECYINGGRFGEVAGAGMEGIGTSDGKGNITWIIDNADIKEFYGGGINFAKPVHGNIHTIISNSHVDQFCGGPKFGDMKSDRTVTTTATDCTFGTYFGAGFGGSSYNRQAPYNHNNIFNFPHNGGSQAGNDASWNAWLQRYYKQAYNATYGGVSTQFDYQFLPMSTNTDNVARIFVEYVAFSKATTHDVTSSLTGCTITGNFYGGGSLGMVDGDVTSTLTNCTVNGSVFGAGYSASIPTVEVMSIGFATEPYYYEDLGTYRMGVFPTPTTTYRWEHGNAISVDNTNHILYTTEDLTTLGQVTGKVTMNIKGNTLVKGNVFQTDNNGNVLKDEFGNNLVKEQSGGVFGGGDASAALGDTEVNINATGLKTGYAYNTYNVFGGGNLADVGGSVTVNMIAGTVDKDVYGGGALANTNNYDPNDYEEVSVTPNVTVVTGYYTKSGNSYTMITAANQKAAANTTYYKKGKWVTTLTNNTTTVNLLGGEIDGDAYGGGLGRIGVTGSEAVYYNQLEADAYNTEHNLQEGDEGYVTTETIKTPAVAAVSEVKATVYGDITVILGKDDASSATKFNIDKYTDEQHAGVVKSGRVFGCNNLNGSPQGDVTVTVYTTVAGSHDKTPAGTDGKAPKTVSDATSYRVAAVYGGGNLANYTTANKKTHVIINGCSDTSIEYVYGGGNAAAVPETDVDINEAYEIGTVFGGGNGKDQYTLDGTTWNDNAGADVNGNANTMLYGGTIHEAFGGSNEKGTISGSVYINTSTCATCPLNVGKLYGAGKNADINGDLIIVLGCKEARTEEVYGGAENANVKGNVELTITSGEFGKVFGGNNQSGAIFGHIKLNIQETSCTPIKIDELYLGGNEAAYSVYGYYVDGTNPITGKPLYKPRSAEMHNTATTDPNYQPAEDNPTVDDDHPFPYDNPELNIISCESIGMVFGGGFGEGAALYGNPTVNINQTYPLEYDETTKAYKVKRPSLGAIGGGYEKNSAHVDGGVFGGGNEATVYGNTTVNIGTETSVNLIVFKYDANGQPVVDGDDIHQTETITGQTFNKVLGANIVGNVYGGGNLADVTGITQVNICAKEVTSGTTTSWQSVILGTAGVAIAGNVYGGGKGVASESGDRAFYCEEAMVGIDGTNSADNNNSSTYADYGTHVRIGNGTIGNGTTGGNVYGGGEIGRVEFHTEVVIGLGAGTGAAAKSPVINGSVFGAGKGTNTHGYSGLVRGDSRVTIQGDAKVGHSVYGGGEMASIGKYELDANGLPKTPKFGGKCTVTIQGYAEIGPDNMQMTKEGGPDDTGHVFGAGKGTLPYENVTGTPWSMELTGKVNYDEGKESDYYKFIQSLGLASNSDVTIGGNAFVKGSVYGGSENGYLQANTHVTIAGGQVGAGYDKEQNKSLPKYAETAFIDPSNSETPVTESNALATCATWTYDKTTTGNPYDKYAGTAGYDAKGGATTATDGHTYYGNVFGGGRGVVPFAAGKWHRAAGSVAGNTQLDITAGHILSSVYGGNENTDVGSYALGTDGEPTTTLSSGGTCTINITGGTVGVPRTKEQIEDNPVIGNVFGAGKGDKRVLFNTWTNVGATSVNISGDAIIYGSVFGGGEDGHVINNAVTNIGGTVTTGVVGKTSEHTYTKVVIGSTGISGADGNVFGGGRGSVTALTAGVVGGNANLTINKGIIMGNVYGGGRLASVGTNFTNPTLENGDPDPRYGELQTPDADHGNIIVTVNDGTIGSSTSTGVNGNIFGGSKGTETNWKLGIARSTTVNMTGGTAYASVYGGGELAQVVGSHTTNGQVLGTEVNISGGTIGIQGKGRATWGNVYAGGKGNTTHVEAGLVKTNTKANISQAEGKTTTIYHNIYGGGAYGSVGTFDLSTAENLSTYHVPYAGMPVNWATGTGTANVTITGGTIGTDGKENGMVFGSSRGDIAAPGEIHDKLAWVNKVSVTVGTDDSETGPQIKGSVYGSGENGHTYTDTEVTVYSGTIGIANSSDPGYSVTSDGTTYSGAEYPYRGNVYGGGCGTDKYYSGSVPEGHTANDGEGNTYNSLAGIVYGTTTVTIDGGHVVRNVYGAGAMGSVGKFEKNASNNAITFASGGKTTIAISGGTIGVDGTKGDGNVFGAARGDKAFTDKDLALVKETGVTISGNTSTTQIKGNVYGGGEVGNVHTNTAVNVQGGAIARNVFGGGKGVEDLFTCEQAMVGVDGEGACQDPDAAVNKNKGTVVTISNGTVGTLNGETLVEGTGNVYGGGEIGRVEWNTQVTIGSATGTSAPLIYGSVFGAGKGLDTHGYSALVRGNSTVIVQGGKVLQNVYGGGEKSTVGRYWVKNIPTTVCDGETEPQAPDVPEGMPYLQRSGGICKVTIQGSAQIGPDAGASANAGHVFGAGKGVNPSFTPGTTERMVKNDDGGSLVPFADDTTLGKTAEELYLEFLQTLALVTNSNVTIDGSATVKGSVYGGSESGFVQHDTKVEIKGGTVNGDAFGGGLGLASFAEAGKVKGNTDLTVSGGAVQGNVYGGGSLGDVGVIDKTEKDNNNKLTYNYYWKQSDGVTDNAHNNNTIDGTNNNSGICKVSVSGGTIGIDNPSDKTKHGNVFGAGRGSSETWWCEKAIVYATDVIVSAGTVKGNVYGGGEVGRVEDDAKMTIGNPTVTDALVITGDVFGAGAGLATHGYSALVRGNAEVTVQGKAQVGGCVYGGGEIASVGRFHVVGGLPKNPQAGGTCTVKILGEAKIGSDGTGHNVFGACKGVTPVYNSSNYKSIYSMQLYENRPSGSAGDTWDYYTTYAEGYTGQKFIKRYYKTPQDYLDFLKTLALTSNTHVTVDGSSSVYGSVYGGGERGITLGGVDVNMNGGTVFEDVYGGGSLADSNTAMWDATNNTLHDYVELELIPGLSVVTGYYTDKSPETIITAKDEKATGTKYYAIYKTNVNLTGGTIKGNAYGGGLGRKEYGTEGQTGYVSPIEAMVYGDVLVELNNNNNGGTANGTQHGCAVSRVFGCNNLNGTPKGKVKVHVYATQSATTNSISTKARNRDNPGSSPYDVDAVYGGGNLSPYIPVDAASTDETVLNAARSQVIIDGCDLTSIRQVYGGGNAASVPATFVEINGTYEIDEVFGGGNGKDNYSLKEGGSDVWYQNPGANVGYFNYTILNPSGTSPGTVASPYYLAVDDTAFDTKEERLADNSAAAALRYGSGIARLEVYGGTIHTSYGGSNLRGNVRTLLSSVYSANGGCTMSVGTSYGGGNLAESDGRVDMVADCAHGIKEMFGGSKNADVDNDINLTITNGSTLERVFGGNNTSGAINGSITVTIEEGGCEPIRIDNLYIGGYLAPYSVYGYKKNADGSYAYIDKTDENGNPIQERIPLMKGEEGALEKPRQDPCLYVVSASHIGNIFGGGYQAKLVGNPHVNVNMKEGKVLVTRTGTEGSYVYKDAMDNAYTDVTSETTGEGTSAVTKYYAVLPLGEIGNIYGGGNMADIIGDTYVEIGTGTCVKFVKDNEGNVTEVEETLDRNGAKITGNVFGGGKGKADTFLCEKAMIGKDGDGVNNPDGGTHVTIGNGTVDCNVYGGGEIGRVEKNTMVTIGLADAGSDKSKPVIKGSVFGGGKGEEEHGYAALVRGNPTVIIQADAKVEHNVYGGGEIASVARYNVPRTEEEVEAARVQGYDAHLGMPYALANTTSGNCKVTVKDNAIIGPDEPMKMYHSEITDGSDKPDDAGHVFGAGKGILPQNYTYVDKEHKPKRMVLRDETIHTDAKKGTDWDYVDPNDINNKNVWEYFADRDAYIIFIQTLALSSYANVIIGDNTSKPFVKGSVYGGSENGLVQFDTKVYIKSGQIGCGKNATAPYGDDVWADGYVPTDDLECASWDYGTEEGDGTNKKIIYAPYDPNANASEKLDQYPGGISTEGGRRIATDGHTYYGNVFGGGSGSVPYFDTTEGISKYLNSAGTVKGDTYVEISGGHILTNVYGGCEATNVLGTAKVTMTGGTLGVPRTPQQIKDHPVTCYLFGAGKGDQRIYFNKETNVNDAIVNVEGGRIYGSVFGGGEDGHVLRNTSVTIGKTDGTGPKIGTVGSTYVDGNVFGGGRGFGGEALTAGNVGGSVDLIINGGTMLGSIYGGGRLASVGYGLYLVNEEVGGVKPYGKMREDNEYDGSYPDPSPEAASAFYTKGRGHITVNINGGTIGSDVEDEHSGNVFGGSMGRLTKIDGSPFDDSDHWSLLATAKTTEVKIAGGTIKRNVYGGGEMGTVIEKTTVNISGGTIGKSGGDNVEIGNVFGGGKGYLDPAQTYVGAGIVKGNTNVAIQNGTSGSTTTTPTIYQNVYGGGELGYVGMFTTPDHKEYTWTENTGLCTVGVAGGMITGHVFGAGKGHDDTFECERAMVRETSVTVSDGKVGGNVYGGGEVGRVDQNSAVTIGSATGDSAPTITGSVFGAGAGVETHGYSALVRGNTAVIVQGNAKVGNSVYGGGQIAAVGRYGLDSSGMPSTLVNGGECVVTVQGNAVIGANDIGNVFGAGMGVDESKKTYTYADNANRPKRMMTYASGLYTDANKALWEFSDATHTYVWEYFDTKTKYLNFLQTLALATDTRLTINGNASVKGSVYGGSESGFVQRDTEVKILGGEILTVKDAAGNITEGNVFGGGKGISDNDAAGRVRSDTRITVLDGTINGDVYGGGALGKANTLSATNTTIVNLLGGTINGDVYGGGLGNATTAADVGNTKVNLNGMTTEELNGFSGDFKTLLTTTLTGLKEFTKKGAVVKGNIFGANNVNGTPKGHVLVHVHGTQNETTSALNVKVDGLYDVSGVFGGGNASDYVPDAADTKQSTEVIIEGCDLTSIEEVYGGGYGAAVPATDVLIKGTEIIDNLYGGGYGAGDDNPGANIGYYTNSDLTSTNKVSYLLGSGQTVVQLMAGKVNNVYGGSNTKGDIRARSNVTTVDKTNDPGCCDKLEVQEIYGGGKKAPMEGGAEVVLGCMPDDWIGEIYAGAREANVGNDVSLTITSGKFERVFGGNRSSGEIDGYVEVNIEECPTCGKPGIIIGELYGGGNLAPYVVPKSYGANYQSPRVNVRSFTSIGTIYGGGLGAGAVVRGNPTVNINVGMVQGGGQNFEGIDAKSLDKQTTVKLYPHEAGKIGVIGNVFGGGNAAPVEGNTTVNIGTNEYEVLAGIIPGETDVTGYYIRSGEAPNYVYTLVEPAAPATPETPAAPVIAQPNTVYCILVKGADIQGNVYGAGNNAEVTGHTNVVIGKKAE